MSGLVAASRKLGIIAGGGDAPRRLMQALEETGRPYFLICLEGHADPDLGAGKDHIRIPLGAGAKLRDGAREAGVEDIVMVGRVRRPSITELKPDWLALQKLTKIGLTMLGDDGLLQAVGKIIEEEGFRLIGAHEVFTDLLTPAGVLGQHHPDAGAWADIRRGIEVATALGQVDVGQAVVVQQGVVLGVEAIEGTDALLTRCAGLKREGEGGVLVKLCKPQQDRRFDLPALGPQTVHNAITAGLRGIAAHAGASLLIDRAQAILDADKAGVFVVGVEGEKKQTLS